MNYTLMPSLEHIALVKVATALWNQDDIRALIARFPLLCSKRETWQEIEDKVIEKLLLQPRHLKEKIADLIKPIGLQIFKWLEYHVAVIGSPDYVISLPNELCWTPQGTIDTKKIAEVLIGYKKLDIINRYKLACIYCLEDDILKLWNKIPENRRECFYSEADPLKVRQQQLVVFWTYYIKGEVAKMDNMIRRRWRSKCSPYQYAFEYAALFGGNKAATEYFLQKLTPTNREKSMVRVAGYVAKRHCYNSSLPKKYYADVICFLLSQMNEEQQTEVLKNYPCEVLICLLDWPRQSLFMKTANRMWHFLSGKSYDSLLALIVNKVKDGYKDYNYQMLFGEFWQQSHNSHKRYVIDMLWFRGSLLTDLFELEDKRNISLILKDATLDEKEKILFYTCESSICTDKWDLLKFLIKQCISSKEVMIKFKEEFRAIMYCYSKEELGVDYVE